MPDLLPGDRPVRLAGPAGEDLAALDVAYVDAIALRCAAATPS